MYTHAIVFFFSERRQEQCNIHLQEPCQTGHTPMDNLECIYDVEKKEASCQCNNYFGFNSTSGRCAGKYLVNLCYNLA